MSRRREQPGRAKRSTAYGRFRASMDRGDSHAHVGAAGASRERSGRLHLRRSLQQKKGEKRVNTTRESEANTSQTRLPRPRPRPLASLCLAFSLSLSLSRPRSLRTLARRTLSSASGAPGSPTSGSYAARAPSAPPAAAAARTAAAAASASAGPPPPAGFGFRVETQAGNQHQRCCSLTCVGWVGGWVAGAPEIARCSTPMAPPVARPRAARSRTAASLKSSKERRANKGRESISPANGLALRPCFCFSEQRGGARQSRTRHGTRGRGHTIQNRAAARTTAPPPAPRAPP